MKKKWNSYSQDNKCYIIAIIVIVVGFLTLLPFAICFSLYSLLIGWAIGSSVMMVNMFAAIKASHVLISEAKLSYTFYLLFVLRMVLSAGCLLVCIMLQYYFKIDLFNYSFIPCVVALLPTQIIFIIVYKKDNAKGSV